MSAISRVAAAFILCAGLLPLPALALGDPPPPPPQESIGGDADSNTNVDIVFEKKDGTKIKQMTKVSDKKNPVTGKHEWEYVLPPGVKVEDFKSIVVTSQIKGKKVTEDFYVAPPPNPFSSPQQNRFPLIVPPGMFPQHILIFVPEVAALVEFGPSYTLDSMVTVSNGLLPGNPYLIVKDATSLPDDIEALFDALAMPGTLEGLPNYTGDAIVEGFTRIPSPPPVALLAAGAVVATRRRRG